MKSPLRTHLSPLVAAFALSCAPAETPRAVTLPSAPRPSARAEAPLVATPPGAFCAAMRAASEAVAARVRPQDERLAKLDFLTCVEDRRGAWALRVDDALIANESGHERLGFAVVLVHRDARGALATLALPSDVLSAAGRSIRASVTRSVGFGGRNVLALVAGDVDGDGDPEANVAGNAFDEDSDQRWARLYTFARGRIAPYGPADGLDVAGFADVDHDGRFDVLTRGPYASFTEDGAVSGSVPIFTGALFVAHAQRDGSFSLTDDVARAESASRCRGGPHVLATAYDEDEAPTQVVCERLFGASPAQVKSDLGAHCHRFVDTAVNPGECAKVLLRIADVTPPLTLTP